MTGRKGFCLKCQKMIEIEREYINLESGYIVFKCGHTEWLK
jgi:hypothetical protein